MTRTWYHGTTATLRPGDLITPGHESNFSVSHPRRVYFTPDIRWALVYAIEVARYYGGEEHVYEVSPVASRTFRDHGSVFGVIDYRARWSCQPLTVLAGVPLTEALVTRASRLITRMEAVTLAAEKVLTGLPGS